MSLGWEYRGITAVGTVLLALAAGTVATVLTGESTFTNTEAVVPTVALIGGVIGVALVPLYTSRPRSVPTLIGRTGRQVAIACLVLVSLGPAGVAAAPDVPTMLVAGGLLAPALPVWYGVCRRRVRPQRVLVVGDQPALLKSTIQSLPVEPLGFLSPVLSEPAIRMTDLEEMISTETPGDTEQTVVTDGGVPTGGRIDEIDGVARIDGLSRLEHVLRERDIDTVALAFSQGDRQEYFGVLRTCHELGVDALVHESLEDQVLQGERVGDALVRVNLEPWPWYSRAAKRAFDVAFATVALLVAAPLLLVIAVTIRLDSPGPILYGQTRTAKLGGTFPVWKFRSMHPESEDANPGNADGQITRVGRVLRKTHLDEIPQLLSILSGKMSVVGPRAVWTDEEQLLQREVESWSKRWTVTPGLTGLAQIRNIDSTNGHAKLKCDLEHIRRQSLWFDLKIIITQLGQVLIDVVRLITERVSTDDVDSQSTERAD
ncbi:exopolysaccharide biosynthesis polyprenyl glycosylphosphotransferase [Natronococcus pandeyae]|uniref:Exopolysaccharide biosynthesis polyprenyl glycosylphosphotransferase n=1 Tax=Natronococcus pandeyae TaxID=2055836 RepID=A0A8J8TSZ7_9EURY|nr:sugar transferase [Natronococcus pandeyae]TYL39309.1 exopolysaccharide biosynthesis polyprenyl glycosylphosphotransferase [Natronococcus pandeyae]